MPINNTFAGNSYHSSHKPFFLLHFKYLFYSFTYSSPRKALLVCFFSDIVVTTMDPPTKYVITVGSSSNIALPHLLFDKLILREHVEIFLLIKKYSLFKKEDLKLNLSMKILNFLKSLGVWVRWGWTISSKRATKSLCYNFMQMLTIKRW